MFNVLALDLLASLLLPWINVNKPDIVTNNSADYSQMNNFWTNISLEHSSCIFSYMLDVAIGHPVSALNLINMSLPNELSCHIILG